MTNGEKIRSMSDDELAYFLEAWNLRYRKVMCSDACWGCHYECERGYICENEGSCADKDTFIKWLQAEEIPHVY